MRWNKKGPPLYTNKSDKDLVLQIQLISIKGYHSLHTKHEFLTFNKPKSESKYLDWIIEN